MKKIKLSAILVLISAVLTGCTPKKADDTVLKIGASPAPHAEILEMVKPILEKQGITLEIKEFTDYILPNKALADGDLDANYFQHKPFMEDFNTQNKADLVSAAAIHYEPLAVYAGKSADFANIKNKAKIAVPNDTTNEARALLLLEQAGIIKIKPGAGLAATVADITDNPKNIDIIELVSAQIPRALADVDFAVINGNYALEAEITNKVVGVNGVPVKEAETSKGAAEFGNIIATTPELKDSTKIKALVEALKSPQVREFIQNKYQGAVVPLD